MDKYIIKNCDCIKEYEICLTSNPPQFKTEYRCGKDFKYCDEKEDCLLKRILAIVDTYRSCYRDPICEIVDSEEIG